MTKDKQKKLIVLTAGGTGGHVYPADALANLLQRETCQVRVLTFVDAEGAVVLTIVWNEDRHSCAAFTRLVGVFHDIDRPFVIYMGKRRIAPLAILNA